MHDTMYRMRCLFNTNEMVHLNPDEDLATDPDHPYSIGQRLQHVGDPTFGTYSLVSARVACGSRPERQNSKCKYLNLRRI